MIQEQREAGASLQRIADRLTADGVKTARGGKWTPMAVLNAINRAAAQG
jgi:recombinase